MTAEAASKVLKGWAYVPYQGYANCVFGDSVGKALPGKTDMAAGVAAWQDTLIKFGDEQGCTVNK